MEIKEKELSWIEKYRLRKKSLGLSSAEAPQNVGRVAIDSKSQMQNVIITNIGGTNLLSEPLSKTKYSYKNKISIRLTEENLFWINQFENRSQKINELIKSERLKQNGN